MWLAVVLIVAACADEIPEDVSQQMEAARGSTEVAADTLPPQLDMDVLLQAAPPGGLTDWIRDVRVGLDSVPARAALDRGDALYAVQELYTRRLEALSIFYGAGGAVGAGAGVTQAVEDASTQLQDLMRVLATDASDAAAIEQSVIASQNALDRVEAAAQAAGLPPDSPRDSATVND
jgi:hypothetical protein